MLALFELALDAQQRDEYAVAIQFYSAALQVSPHFVLYNNRGTACARIGKLESAIADYDKAIALNPEFATAYNNRGSAYYEQGRLDMAITEYNQSIALNPQNATAYDNRGNVYYKQGKLEQALADFGQAMVLTPDATTYNKRGLGYVKREEIKRAITAHAQAIALKPEYVSAFQVMYERYVAKIYNYIAFRVGVGPEAEDLTAEVFLKAMQSLNSYRWQEVPFSAWLLHIAHNWVVDYLCRKKRRGEVPLEERHRPPDEDMTLLTEHVLVRQEIKAAISQLTEAQQQVIALRFAAGCSIKETAKVMGKTEGAIKSLQHNGLLTLRRLLADYRRAQSEGSH
jgi:RNA polymerase sigma-70 factor (ECF subfamily)